MMKIILFLLAGALLALPAGAAAPLVLNSSFYAPITAPAGDGLLDLLYAELFKRAGVAVEIQAASAERGLLNANSGVDDGDVARVFGIEQTYPNLVRVAEPVMYYQMVAFSRKPRFTVAGAAGLQAHDVGILTGWKVLERGIVGSRSLLKLETGRQLFAMLDLGRIDVAVIEKYEGLHFVKSMGLRGIAVMEPAVAEGDWYLYLHKKHAALAPRLAEELRKMKRDGTHRRIVDAVMKRYAQ
jgi:polar amino acid transport system substrate-binding protein